MFRQKLPQAFEIVGVDKVDIGVDERFGAAFHRIEDLRQSKDTDDQRDQRKATGQRCHPEGHSGLAIDRFGCGDAESQLLAS